MYQINPTLAIDSYKLGHMTMYPKDTTKVYCNLTPRNTSRLQSAMPSGFYDGKVVVYGVSAAMQEIHESFQTDFFDKDVEDVIEAFIQSVTPFVGDNSTTTLETNLRKLHTLGYLPLVVKSLPEGSRVNAGIPLLTITNTHPDFAWLPNYLETFISAQVWKLSTAATIADVYKGIFIHFAKLTGADLSFCDFQGHDFSSRGMSGIIDSARTGSSHLTSFMGSDSVSSVDYSKQYYSAAGFIAGSVPATEHSVMCLGSKEGEVDTFRRLFEIYPKGVVSIVSDTWDYWNTLTNIASELKPEIMSRQKDSLGLCKTVFRPDSGNPVDVIVGTGVHGKRLKYVSDDLDTWKSYVAEDIHDTFCTELIVKEPMFSMSDTYWFGSELYMVTYTPDLNRHDKIYYYVDNYGTTLSKCVFKQLEVAPETKGSVQCLWETFGGTKTHKGYKVLDEHVGLIYGDSITPQRAVDILQGLADKGFASSNIVLGIGSYTYQYVTRDTLGFAMKATYAEIGGKGVQIFKRPKTDSGKTSAKGMLRVDLVNGEYVLTDKLNSDDGGELAVLFKDGEFYNKPTLNDIRGRLNGNR